ncbi:hypothetical protein H311_03667 [Anncaliia algerae PRA109]|nr:hypothetical protein H311_03667 [Anncaliia algerae PRA109]
MFNYNFKNKEKKESLNKSDENKFSIDDNEYRRSIELKEIKNTSSDDRIKLLSSVLSQNRVEVNDLSFIHNYRLPSNLQKLSKVFIAIKSICKFNENKELVTIFHNSKKCIENIVNQQVSIEDIERLNYVYPEAFEFTKVKINYENREIDSFTIKLKENNVRELEKRLKIIGDLQRKTLFEEAIDNLNKPLTKKRLILNEKGTSILERIKLKEKMRKEAFIKNNSFNYEELKEKIKQIYYIENKKSIEKKKIIQMLDLFNADKKLDHICKLFSDEFELKTINKIDYIICKLIK